MTEQYLPKLSTKIETIIVILSPTKASDGAFALEVRRAPLIHTGL